MKRESDVHVIVQILGLVIVIIGISFVVAGNSFDAAYRTTLRAIVNNGYRIIVIGFMFIIVDCMVMFMPRLPTMSECMTTIQRFATTKRGQWNKVFRTDYSGRDLQVLCNGILYRGQIESIELLNGLPDRVNRTVRIRCKWNFVRTSDKDEHQWHFDKAPMATHINYETTVPTIHADGRVEFTFIYALKRRSETVVILAANDVMQPQEQDSDRS